jgi:hypothetical protein
MSYYKDYIQGLCPELESWQVNQICGELDSRDDSQNKLKEEFEEYKSAIEAYIGSSKVASALDEYRWNQEQKTT